jgi:nitrogen-specific signal transduction histidine kinase
VKHPNICGQYNTRPPNLSAAYFVGLTGTNPDRWRNLYAPRYKSLQPFWSNNNCERHLNRARRAADENLRTLVRRSSRRRSRRVPRTAAGRRDGHAGPGILPEERERVFDRFYRADKSRGRIIEGAGLGLSLAREIAHAHGGDLVLEDSKPIVTKFSLTLPIE